MISSTRDFLAYPTTDVLSWVFSGNSITTKSKGHPIWIDSYNPSQYVDVDTARTTIKQLIRGFRQQGLQRGDVVCVHSFNNIWYPAIYLAIIGAGAIFVGSNPAYKPTELGHLFTSSKAKFLIVEPSQAGHVLSVAAEVGIALNATFSLDADTNIPSGFRQPSSQLYDLKSWRRLLEYGEDDWVVFNDSGQSQTTPAVYLSSSGTTGLPKIVVMSHYAVLAQLVMSDFQVERVPSEIRRLITLPFFHSFALPFPILSLYRHQSLFIMPRYSTKACLKFINDFQITMMPIVPPMAKALFGIPQPSATVSQLTSLTELVCAGAPMDAQTQNSIVKRLPPSTRLTQLWGMSETGWLTTFRHPESDFTASVGRLLPGVSVKLINETHDEVSDWTQTGEICVQTPGIMMGYLGKEQTTHDMFAGEYLRTGDIGRCEGGKWYIVDRAKDIIKVRGWQVSPVELEVCLLNHPAVKDAAVVGVPDEFSGEEPRAFVIAHDSTSTLDHNELANDLKLYVAKNLASYKSLAGGIVFVDEIPRTVSGKVLRRLLRQQMPVTA